MSPVRKTNVALTIQHGQWKLPQLIAAIQSHLDHGYSLYTFLNKENSLAIIYEILLLCTETKIIKLLKRYDRILHQGDYLTKMARRKLARVIRTYLPLNIDKQTIQKRALQINLTESTSKLPFVEAIFTNNTSLSNHPETYPVTRVLCDTGSDCSLIPYKLFKAMGFQSKCLMPEPIYNIKGSTGLSKNIVLGSIQLNMYIKTKWGQFGKINHKFLICNPSLQLDHILLGLDILGAMQAEIKCDGLQITATLQNDKNQVVKMDLFTVSSKQVTAYLTNVNTITAGQSSGIFSLTNVDNSNLEQCQITSNHDSLKLSYEAISPSRQQ